MRREVYRSWERMESCMIFSRIKLIVEKLGRKRIYKKLNGKRGKAAEYWNDLMWISQIHIQWDECCRHTDTKQNTDCHFFFFFIISIKYCNYCTSPCKVAFTHFLDLILVFWVNHRRNSWSIYSHLIAQLHIYNYIWFPFNDNTGTVTSVKNNAALSFRKNDNYIMTRIQRCFLLDTAPKTR